MGTSEGAFWPTRIRVYEAAPGQADGAAIVERLDVGLAALEAAPATDSDTGGALVEFVQVSAGHEHSAAISADGRVWTTGRGIGGRLGHGDYETRLGWTPIESLTAAGVRVRRVHAAGQHTLLIDTTGRAWGFGFNQDGKCGLGQVANAPAPTPIPALEGVTVAEAIGGQEHSAWICGPLPRGKSNAYVAPRMWLSP